MTCVTQNICEHFFRFRDKYHPDASEERNDQFKEAVKARFVYIKFLPLTLRGDFKIEEFTKNFQKRVLKIL